MSSFSHSSWPLTVPRLSLRGIFSHSLTRVQFYLLAIDLDPFLTDMAIPSRFQLSCPSITCPKTPDMTHLSAVPSTILSFHIVRIGDAPVFPADEALRSSRTFAPTKDLLSICLHSIFPCQFSISAFHTRFSKRKRQLLTRTTLPPLTPSFLCHGSTPF